MSDTRRKEEESKDLNAAVCNNRCIEGFVILAFYSLSQDLFFVCEIVTRKF